MMNYYEYLSQCFTLPRYDFVNNYELSIFLPKHSSYSKNLTSNSKHFQCFEERNIRPFDQNKFFVLDSFRFNYISFSTLNEILQKMKRN